MDQVSFATRLDGIATLTVSADAEIMQNYQAALPVAANHSLASVEDSDGNPMVFTLGGDHHLYLIMADPGGPTGWKQLDLTPSLGSYGTPTTFAVGQVKGGNITLVVAAATAGGSPTILIAGPLSNGATDWSQLGDYWISAGNPQPAATLETIYVGPADASGGFDLPLVAVGYTGGTPGAPNDYLLQPSLTATGINWRAVSFPTPTDASDIHDYAMGVIGDLGTGLYILYDNQAGQSQLVFKTLPDPTYGRTYVRELTAPTGATCLETTVGTSTTTDLYVGGSAGVTHFAPDHQTDRAVGVSIASSQDVPDIRDGGLIVRQDQVTGGTVAIWALSGENLMYFHSSASEPGGYSKPVLFEAGVAEVAPIRSQSKKANQLVFVKTDVQSNPNIVWMWQDPQSGLWQRDAIPLQSTGATLEYNCYTTTLTFLDPKGQARPNLAVKVYASGWTRTLINGVCHLLDQSAPVTATTDLTGNLTIINPVCDLATPRFVVTSADPAWFDGALVIEPAAKVYQRLKQVQSGGDIPSYVLAKLPAGVTQDQVATAIQKLMAYQPDPAPQGTIITWQASEPTLCLAVQPVQAPSDHQAWSLSFGTPKTTSFSVVGEIWDGVTNVAGDLWQFATSVIDQVIGITVDVIENALTFVVNLVGKTIQIVIKTLEDVFKAITFILQKVAAVLKDIIKWLGFLFNWKDIWNCHLVLANFTTSGLDYLLGRLDAGADVLKAGIHGIFGRVKTAIHTLVLPDDVANTDLQSQQAYCAQSSPDANLNQTPTNWVLYQTQHGGVAEGSTDDSPPTPGNPLVQFFQDVMLPTIQGLQTDIEQVMHDIGALFQGNPTVGALLTIIVDVADTFLDALENLLVGLVDFAVDLMADFQALITMALEIPFFSGLYRFVTGLMGGREDLTVVNVLSLVAAIPVTIVYKLITGQAPLPDDITPLLAPDVFAQMMQRSTSKALVLAKADDAESVDKTDFSYLYSHLGGVAAALLLPVKSVLDLFTLDRQITLEDSDKSGSSTPLTESGKKNLAKNIGYLNIAQIGLGSIILSLSFPVPKNDWDAADDCALGNWLVGGARLVTAAIVPPLCKKVLGEELGKRVAKEAAGGADIAYCVAQGVFLLVTDILDSQALGDATGLPASELLLKYFQDTCTVSGAIITDIGNMASVVPSASVKMVADAARAGGIVIGGFGSVFLLVRVGLSVGAGLEKVIRVGLG